MRVGYGELAGRLGITSLQILVELAVMRQPWRDCWPTCEEGFEATIREQRRIRLGLPITGPRADTGLAGEKKVSESLPVSENAAAILNKLMLKAYGLKRVRVVTLINRWVHAATEDDVRELIHRGNLKWADPERSTVNLVADKIADTETIVETFRRLRRIG